MKWGGVERNPKVFEVRNLFSANPAYKHISKEKDACEHVNNAQRQKSFVNKSIPERQNEQKHAHAHFDRDNSRDTPHNIEHTNQKQI